MNLVDRFRYVMKVYNETPSSFADKIGVQRSSISHILSERNKPSLDFIQKILEYYPKIDAQWLVNGKQSTSVKDATSEVENPNEPLQKEPKTIEEKNTIKLDRSVEPDLEERGSTINKIDANSAKKVDRIIIFYSDHTFETFNPPN